MNYLKRTSKSLGVAIAVGLVVATAVSGTATPAHAQTYSPLYSFPGGTTEPGTPAGILAQGQDGNLYGVSGAGGSGNCYNARGQLVGCGTIFLIVLPIPTGGQPTVLLLHSFSTKDGCTVGLNLGSDGNFYGGCVNNGAYGKGYVFQFNPNTLDLIDLHDFCQQGPPNCPDGATPSSRPVEGTDGNYYGTTLSGGAHGYGTVYYINPTTKALTTILNFTNDPNVSYPSGPLFLGSNGNLYGATKGGVPTMPACPPNCGAVYEISNSGAFFKVLHTFTGSSDGATPNGVFQGKNGDFYGTTLQGGGENNQGTIFTMTPTSNEAFDSYSFPSTASGLPRALSQASNGDLYGDAFGGNGDGSLFGIPPKGSPLIYTYDLSMNGGAYGVAPDSALSHTSGILFGVTAQGGADNHGVFYSLTLPEAPEFCRPQIAVGQVGDPIGILGQGFSPSSEVYFGDVQATVTSATGNFITTAVPTGAQTGMLTVKTGSKNLESVGPFYVLP